MIKAVLELSQYILALNMFLYTFLSFYIFRLEDKNQRKAIYGFEMVLIFLNHMIGYLVILSKKLDINYLFFFVVQVLVLLAYVVMSKAIYEGVNKQLLNHVCMLLSISFVVLARISYDKAMRQSVIVLFSLICGMIIPWVLRYIKNIKKGTWAYAAIGAVLLLAVLLLGKMTNGSKLSFSIAGVSLQPSEFVKILFVFAIAGLIWEAKSFLDIFVSAGIALAYIAVLVASKDLGSALIFFIVYITMLYVASCNILYLISGIMSGGLGAYLGYFLFSHVRVRVNNWLNPWNDLDGTGYQITQSLFAIGTGKWFGMGICGGNPTSIPYVEQDFVFSAICEEYGVIFGICLILVCISLFLLIIDIARECKDRYGKLIVVGLGTTYIFQVLLTIGGGTKFIPMTGVTLPLISYGGSSVLSSVILMSVIQGLYLQRNYVTDPMKIPRVLRSMSKSEQSKVEKEQKKRIAFIVAKKQLFVVGGIYSCLFLGMIGYLSYFVYTKADTVINNSYNNKRQEIMATRTYRGDILTEGGDILATTKIDEQGNEIRVYPYNSLFAHAVGYSTNGRMGVEQLMNISLIKSNDSFVEKIQNDLEEEKHQGNTVVTTFDVDLQKIASESLGAYNGAIIVSDPKTGKILAMVSKPDFDPNQIDQIWDSLVNDDKSSVLLNRSTQGLYPPGSTFKIVTALEYIKENMGSYESYQYNCNGKFTNNGSSIKCYHGTKHGSLDFYHSFAKSCNSSFANISLLLDCNEFEDTINQLLFNQELPVDFPYKKSQVIMGLGVPADQIMQTAIGQGKTQVTPLQINMLTNAIANGGMLMKPYYVSEVKTGQGKTITAYSPQTSGMLMTEEESRILTEMMELVVKEGTGTKLAKASYTAAGKTGSAEYNSFSDSHAWFTGFAPAEDPQISVTIIVEGAGSGGDYAVPIAKRIFDQYFK